MEDLKSRFNDVTLEALKSLTRDQGRQGAEATLALASAVEKLFNVIYSEKFGAPTEDVAVKIENNVTNKVTAMIDKSVEKMAKELRKEFKK